MFVGWVLAIVPALHSIKHVIVILVVAVVGFALVLVPAGMELFLQPAQTKRGPTAILIAVLPSAVLFLITVLVVPVAPVFRVLAIVAELAGMAIFIWSWVSAQGQPSGATR
jgi:hypothetical protein